MIKKLFAVVATLSVSAIASYGAVTPLLNYQGKLTDSGGNPLTGNYSILFSVYNVSTGGGSIWSETQTVSADSGFFNVLLGSVNNLTLPFDVDYWLGVKVGSDAEMTPRQRLAVAGYSIRSGTASYSGNCDTVDGYDSSEFAIGGGTISSKLTITQSANDYALEIANTSAGRGIKIASVAGGTGQGLYIDQYANDGALSIQQRTNYAGISINNYGTSAGINIMATGASAGRAAVFTKSVTSPSGEAVYIDHYSDGDALYVNHSAAKAGYAIHTVNKTSYFQGGYSDIAEYFPGAMDVEAGDVVVIDNTVGISLKKSKKEYDPMVAGVISTQPMFQYGSPDNDISDKSKQKGVLLAIAGRVPCKADASYGEIKIGDLLTSSPTPGHAMKAVNPVIGTVIGKSMTSLKSGQGTVTILLSLD